MATMRTMVVESARRWIGTPYHHQASVQGVGCDCLGLVRGVWRDVYGMDTETPPPYSKDWGEATGVETMLLAAARHLRAVPVREMAVGDVLIFRLKRTTIAKHSGILSCVEDGRLRMVHSTEGVGVVEVHLNDWWKRRIAGVFRFPDIVVDDQVVVMAMTATTVTV